MTTVGIAGMSGFLGWHLRSYVHGFKDIRVIGAGRQEFADEQSLVSSCDCIVHFAGLNRGTDIEVYNTNVDLTDRLIQALKKSGKAPQVIFASSTQILKNNPYGNSKIECAKRLRAWARNSNALFTNCILPNIFGEGCKPFYNSFIATFCHQIASKLEPKVLVDAEVECLHAQEVAGYIYDAIQRKTDGDITFPGKPVKVSGVLDTIRYLSGAYEKHIIPDLRDKFVLQLFNTYRFYLYPQFYPVPVRVNRDDRGVVFETAKSLGEGQCFISSTKPGITRGNHYHLNKYERFFVVKGKAVIRIRRLFSDKIIDFEVDGDEPRYVDIPTLHTHCITNTGNTELMTLFWADKIFDPNSTDTYMENIEVKNEKN
jgi:UDP-2-acetamido-2,6-beta-L-arabino-hexul-4-ose reductase